MTADRVAELFRSGRIRPSDECREAGSGRWRTVDELFPLLKYDSSATLHGGSTMSPARLRPSVLDGADEPGDVQRPVTSALKAGWICFGLGLIMAWFFPLAHVFFSIAIVTAIVAMCTHQVDRGLALLLASFVGIVLCAGVFLVLVVGAVSAAVAPAIKQAELQRKQSDKVNSQAAASLAAAGAQVAQSFAAMNLRLERERRENDARAERQRQYEGAVARAPELKRLATEEAQRQYDRERAERQRTK